MQELREATGLTQQQLADFVMESRATISMFESGLRPMPIAAMQQLTELFLLLPTNANAENIPLVVDELALQTTAADKAVENYQRQCNLKLQRKLKQLKHLETNYTQCLKLLQALRSLAQQLPKNKNNSYQHAWIRIAEQEALEKLDTCSLAKQQILHIQIEQLTIH